ncbi:hypothetical protein F4804DRAFT_297917 [Jackrogersella minutella]|nr:hypothetical protein F4804DRAFT_297917 [Jackrogersella minutella]
MASMRAFRSLTQIATVLRQERPQSRRLLPISNGHSSHDATSYRNFPRVGSPFHTTSLRCRGNDESPRTDISALDVLGNTPVPSTAIDVCASDGFHLNSGTKVFDGSGVLLVGGEAFSWRPWLPRGEKRLLNKTGQWEIPNETLNLLGLVWPRPDLLILGLGPEIRPLSPATRRHISSLGLRVEVLDTRNAAAHFNMLATERGVNDVAAALIPIGWREGIGAT